MTIEIDSVKLQRDLRERAYHKYQHLSLREEVAAIKKSLRQEGLWPPVPGKCEQLKPPPADQSWSRRE
jgi:hypothetical protein